LAKNAVNAHILTLNIENFMGALPQIPTLGMGHTDPTPHTQFETAGYASDLQH